MPELDRTLETIVDVHTRIRDLLALLEASKKEKNIVRLMQLFSDCREDDEIVFQIKINLPE